MKIPKMSKVFKRPTTARSNQASQLRQSAQTAKPAAMAVVRGDIAKLKADAIVNAANTGLQAGGGVCGAIFKAAGSDYQKLAQACSKHKGCDPGDAKITSGKFGSLNCKHIIHAVGPDCRDKAQDLDRDRLLGLAYDKAIRLADEAGCTSVVFPALSTGIFGFDANESTKIAIETVNESLKACKNLKEVTFCCFDAGSEKAYLKELAGSSSSPPASTQTNIACIPARFATIPNRIALTQDHLSITGKSIVDIDNVDAIVNPTDPDLSCGGVVSQLMVAAYGDEFQKSTQKLECKPASAVMDNTRFGDSKVKVVHVAGPSFDSADKKNSLMSLAATYRAAIELADKNGCKSIAMPAISTGAQGFPIKDAAKVAVGAVSEALEDCSTLRKVQFCYHGPDAKAAYDSALEAVDTDSLKPAAKKSSQSAQLGNSKQLGPNLKRFHEVLTDASVDAIKNELEAGEKTGHWMWFAFPQISGLGQSENAEKFGVQGLDEAKAFLNDQSLEANLRQFTSFALNAALNSEEGGAEGVKVLFGEVDAQKFHACMTLFSQAEGESGSHKEQAFFQNALDIIYKGTPHTTTNMFLNG
jgi:O-acetyl-ADP-ribose deacetylase (regulator of RNase III)/uncharacterized protein (DUF1810 family)